MEEVRSWGVGARGGGGEDIPVLEGGGYLCSSCSTRSTCAPRSLHMIALSVE